MTARAHSRTTSPVVAAEGSLPWWALVLPVLTFVALLTLLVLGGPAQSSTSTGPALGELIVRVQQAFGG